MKYFSIGELSKRSQVKIPTIRYYEGIDLLPEPERSASNRRVYTENTLRQLSFIRRARELGFDLEAIRQLHELLKDPTQPCEGAHIIASERLAEINEKIRQLKDLKGKVELMLQCDHNHHVEDCSILEILDGEKEKHNAT